MGIDMARETGGQNGTTLKEFAEEHGYMPATVVGHEEHRDGMTLITLDSDEDTNIETYDGNREAHRVGNTPDDS
jgi:hypothetical protein